MGFNEERRKNLIIAEDYQPNIYLLEAEESPAAVSLLGRSYVAVWVTGKIPAVSGLFVLFLNKLSEPCKAFHSGRSTASSKS